MTRGRNAEPAALRALRGNPRRRAIDTTELSVPPGAPDKPAAMSPEAAAEWDRVLAELPADVLSRLDGPLLEVFCESYVLWQRAMRELQRCDLIVTGAKGGLTPHPLLRIANAAWSRMMTTGDRLGFSPAARAKIRVPARKTETDKLTEFLES